MFRPDRTHLNPSGLSKQSSKIYKTVRQKSNADLDKTLKQLKIEHKASISRILREEYTLKNAQSSVKPRESFAREVQMDSDCEPHEQDMLEGTEYLMDDKSLALEKTAFVSKMVSCRPSHTREQHKKRHYFHLPSIMEESTRCFLTQKTKNAQLEKSLPPLNDTNNNPSRSREHPEEHSERYRSKTISIPDETRNSPRYFMRKRSNDERFAFNTKRKDGNSLEKDNNDLSPQGWGEEMLLNCRYLRRSYSSPNVFDIESFTKK